MVKMRLNYLLLLYAVLFFAGPVECARKAVLKFVVASNLSDQNINQTLTKIVWDMFEIKKYAIERIYINLEMKQEVCEAVGDVDRTKGPSDFLLLAIFSKGVNGSKKLIDCDIEWGKENFAILRIDSIDLMNNLIIAEMFIGSSEKFYKYKLPVKNMHDIIQAVEKYAYEFAESRIPDEYPQTAHRAEMRRQRTYKAIISLLALFVAALLVIMFMKSLASYKARKHKGGEDHHKKKHNEVLLDPPPPSKEKATTSAESTKSSEKVTNKSTKSASQKDKTENGPKSVKGKTDNSQKATNSTQSVKTEKTKEDVRVNKTQSTSKEDGSEKTEKKAKDVPTEDTQDVKKSTTASKSERESEKEAKK